MPYKGRLSLILCFVTALIQAQVPDYNLHISKAFRISGNTAVEITNKYGSVQVIPWNSDSVKFIIDLRIKAKDHTKLEKMKQGIEFEFIPGQSYLVAHTRFNTTGSDVFKDLVDIAGSYLSSGNSVTINYKVMIPSRTSLKIENRFGDVFLEDHDGPLNVILSYGDLKADRLDGRSTIKLTSGDGEINRLSDGQITVSYGNLHVRDANQLTTLTQSSVITIDQADAIKINSRRDKYFMNEVRSVAGDTYFSNINLINLSNDISMTCRYGHLTIDKIKRSFTLCNLSSSMTDLSLSFEKPLSFDFELTHFQTVVFIYPKAIARLSTKVFDATAKLFLTTGTMGTGTPDSRVVIQALRKCTITISQK